MHSVDFYQGHLDKVSRSFAFCIKQLRSPHRLWVSLTYLVCRILDTVEDAPWSHKQIQLKTFADFEKSLISPEKSGNIKNMLDYFPEQIPKSEKSLLADSEIIFKDLHQFPTETKAAIQDMVRSMCLGMQHFVKKEKDGILKLQTLTELNQYCFFVAGVVGEALSKLILSTQNEYKLNRNTLLRSFHFGLFLQKVNILKDQIEDEGQGRFFVPDRQAVYKSLVKNADNSLVYIKEIPKELNDYKLFCSWSFFLGMASLPYLHDSYLKKKQNKISKLETWRVLEHVKSVIDDNEKLESLYTGYRGYLASLVNQNEIEQEQAKPEDTIKDQEVFDCYLGQLSPAELKELEVIS